MLGDKAYDSAELHEELDERGTKPVIPNRCNRKQPSASISAFTSFAGASRVRSTGSRTLGALRRATTGWLETICLLSVWPQHLYGGFNESGP